MNFLRGLVALGITLCCYTEWIIFDTTFGVFSMAGTGWSPVNILFYASFLTSGIAFYNSFSKKNQLSWIYFACGFYGVGATLLVYVSMSDNVGLLDMFVALFDEEISDYVTYEFAPGIYATGVLSFLLLLIGINASGSAREKKASGYHNQKKRKRPSDVSHVDTTSNSDNAHIQDWLKKNPGKTLIDYYSKFK